MSIKALDKHLVRGQIIRYEKNGKVIKADILSDYYCPTKNNAHIYTLKVLNSGCYDKGSIITESARVLYCTAKIIIDVSNIKYKALVNDKMVRKMKATKFKKIPKDIRMRL
jgi:hypothetical protein